MGQLQTAASGEYQIQWEGITSHSGNKRTARLNRNVSGTLRTIQGHI